MPPYLYGLRFHSFTVSGETLYPRTFFTTLIRPRPITVSGGFWRLRCFWPFSCYMEIAHGGTDRWHDESYTDRKNGVLTQNAVGCGV